ncbi:dermonecrotic toxin domain-containing protein [Pseudomonas trivialis]|uniref:RING-type E3 ubiquitin transferase n=1 Tax=Pseudomonas trivialis TaxID=200450 RepID=A0A0R2ZDL7_9PSED|nr:DUF6543 domain-containing protein [Pseudomonas trivialis]KRP58826.1 hypothetical protein TU79_17355 [Pseudomonas trivialis]SDT16628.1 C-terminal novel E3 ligase, LRR-interacting [Pseudomonas trivialis]
MPEPTHHPAPKDPLAEFMTERRVPLLTRSQWSALQNLDVLRVKLDAFFGGLNDQEKHDYVRLQQAWIDAQRTVEKNVKDLTHAFEQQAMALLRAELQALTGQDIDPVNARIHTRYLQPELRVRRAADGERGDGVVKVASLRLWDAACLNYDGLTGWSYPGRTGLADASYLDTHVNATAAEFITLVRRLDLGGQLRQQLDDALKPQGLLGRSVMGLATAEFDFALIDALRNAATSGIDREKYQWVKRALSGKARWGSMEEMLLFVPHGVDNVSWLPQLTGLTGHYVRPPPGDRLSIPHLVFSIAGCKGAFSFFPNRPGGALRHFQSHRRACDYFYVAFDRAYREGDVDWLYPMMLLRDCARLKRVTKATAPPADLEGVAYLIYRLAQSIPAVDTVGKIGYVRETVEKVPVVSLNDFYIKRCRANLQEMAHQTPGFMPTLLEVFKTLALEILNVLLIPVPGALKGLGRVRSMAMFVALEQALVEGANQAMQGEPGDLLQGFADLADLLVSGRLHTRLANSVQRRHQRLYRRLSEARAVTEQREPTASRVLETMLGSPNAPARDMAVILMSSDTSQERLDQVWAGAPPSASLVDAVERFQADRLIDWVAEGVEPTHTVPVDAADVLAPLLTQLPAWPADTALSIASQQGVEVRRYSKGGSVQPTTVVSVTALENHQFAYGKPPQFTAHLPTAIIALLPEHFSTGEPRLRQQLAMQARAGKTDLFEALTRFAEFSRSTASGARPPVYALLPDRVTPDMPVPTVITQLRALHPDLSLARLLEILREHPLSEHQQTQLLESQLQPEALYQALRAARLVARREKIIDGLFHGRRFDRQTWRWAAELTDGVMRDLTGQRLVVGTAGQAVPYVSKGLADRNVVVIDQMQGRFAAYHHHQLRTGATLMGADAFYDAIVSQLSAGDRLQLGLSALQGVADLRHQVARAMLRNRAPDGSFYPYRREILHYATTADTTSIDAEPDALGFYRRGADRYLFIEGEYFKVFEDETLGRWRVQHPSLKDAYSPELTHNGAGAWRHEWENPLTWDGQKPFYRLGPLTRALSPDAIEQIQQISAVTPAMLRRVQVRNEPPPAILLDTLERYTLQQRVMKGVQTGRDFFDEVLGEVGPDLADELVGHAGLARVEQVAVLEARVDADKPQMERHFYKALRHKKTLASRNPHARVLQRYFPGLSAWAADDLVYRLTPVEQRSLEAGRLPLSLMQDIRWTLAYSRRARAVEGLYIRLAANEDSTRLIMRALPTLQGWPDHLRIEVRERGGLIDSAGPEGAALTRILEPFSYHYQAYTPHERGERQAVGSPGPFLTVLLAALPKAERQALGYTHAGGPEALLRSIADRERHTLESADPALEIDRRPRFNPPRRFADGRIGYPLSGGEELGPVAREQVARLRALYPARSDEEVLDLLREAGDSTDERTTMIDYLVREQRALDLDLQQWRDAASADANDAVSVRSRALAVARIQRCWAREGLTPGIIEELNLDDLELTSLPTLRAHFGHVTLLNINGNHLAVLPPHFLRSFPGLRMISLKGNRLSHLPDMEGLAHLAVLNLSNNLLRLDLQDEFRLAALTGLRRLDLSVNPLGQGRRLSLYQLTRMRELSLRNCGLDRLPRGAVTLRALRSLDLRNNAIRELAETDLFIYPEIHRAMNLRGNPLSAQARQLLRRIGERQGQPDIDFGLWDPAASFDQRADRWLALLPPAEVQARQLEWAALQEQPMADCFFELLGNIADYPLFADVGHRTLRETITRRMWRLVGEALFHGGGEQIYSVRPYGYMGGGIDGCLLSLHELELLRLPYRMLAADVQNAGPAFVHYYRALRRLDSINEHVRRYFPGQADWQACTRIYSYRIALADSLDLPLVLASRFNTPLARPDDLSVATLRASILREEVGMNWPLNLRGEEHWVEFLKRKYRSRFATALRGYDRLMEIAGNKVADAVMTEGEYLRYVHTLQAARRTAENTLVAELTEREWTDFVIG